MWDGGNRNKMEFEIHETGCFLNVEVIEERWITKTTRVTRVLNLFSYRHNLSLLRVTHIECCRTGDVSEKNDGKQISITCRKDH
jgi:hypothetical protein